MHFKILYSVPQVRTDIAGLQRSKFGGLTCIHDGFTILMQDKYGAGGGQDA